MNHKKQNLNLRRELACRSDGLNHCNRKNRTCFAPQGATCTTSQPFPAVPSRSQPCPAMPSHSQLLNSKIWLTRPQHIQLAPNHQLLEDILLRSVSFEGLQGNIEHALDVASCRIVDFACQNSRHVISFFCRSVNVCPCVSQSCPPRSVKLGTATARSVPVSSQALTLLRVLLPAYLILSSPRKTPRLRRPSSLQKVPGPGHEGIGSPGWLHKGCGANGS